MREIEQIYHNDFGVAFHWKKNNVVLKDRVQIVFKETGFYFSVEEIQEFNHIIDNACRKLDCGSCSLRGKCHKFLLKTPLNEVDLAVSEDELFQIKDLMEGTLFIIALSDYLNGVGRN
ncbi:hypothetical protein HYN59_03185 [Flavobacterium album]|uniref:Uncharacterized protein n=1 Tax=Flavobacterium album TaxID=2175091 RepID=A0A2S1QUU5_9FLAO|nr:hypothetical protein [Flavobacterium album]AWH84177.1 hypothetical protein HYN59_03185 [Flavobacterium album]